MVRKFIFSKNFFTIGAIFLGGVGILLINLYNNYYEENEQKIYKENIINVKTELNGYIIAYSWNKVYAGTKLATLSTGDKLFVSTTPYDRNGYSLFDCLNKEAYLYKPANTDSIFITKPNGNKCFCMTYWKQGSN